MEPSWNVAVAVDDRGSRLVIRATFVGAGTANLAIAPQAEAGLGRLEVEDGNTWRTVSRSPDGWVEPSCREVCTVRYTLDLERVAAASDDPITSAVHTPEASLSPAMVWLLHPKPKGDVPVDLRFTGARVATGLRGLAGGHRFFSQELDEGSFTAFGRFRRQRVRVEGATIELVVVGTFASSDADLAHWVERSARIAASLYGRFAVREFALFVVPALGERDAVRGKVLALSGLSVAVHLGERALPSDLEVDRVLLHELLHLGFPTFRGEARWFGEGIATYYVPLLLARRGELDARVLWENWLSSLPPAVAWNDGGPGLDGRDDDDAVYLGGAAFALVTDVAIRARTNNRRSLDDVLAAVVERGGSAEQVWTTRKVLAVANEATGTSVVSDLYERFGQRGERIELAATFAALGVSPGRLDDDAPLAHVRRAMESARRGPFGRQGDRFDVPHAVGVLGDGPIGRKAPHHRDVLDRQ